jgi:hypothetical protein
MILSNMGILATGDMNIMYEAECIVCHKKFRISFMIRPYVCPKCFMQEQQKTEIKDAP